LAVGFHHRNIEGFPRLTAQFQLRNIEQLTQCFLLRFGTGQVGSSPVKTSFASIAFPICFAWRAFSRTGSAKSRMEQRFLAFLQLGIGNRS
jgi:hypothetical protein